MAETSIDDLLKDRFKAAKSIEAMTKHFRDGVDEYHKGQWEKSLGKMGKFLEAVFKVLLEAAGLPARSGRQFKVNDAINGLAGASTKGTVDDTIRLTIPRCLQFMYDVASNRGGRHDPDEVDANEMDATAMLMNGAWVLAEMVRYAQAHRDLTQAKAVVDGLMKRKYPFYEVIDGRVYFDVKPTYSARDLGLLLLWQRGSQRINREDLIDAIRRQRRGVKLANAKVAVGRLANVVDDDGAGNLTLRLPGYREAEQLLSPQPLIRKRKGKRKRGEKLSGFHGEVRYR